MPLDTFQGQDLLSLGLTPLLRPHSHTVASPDSSYFLLYPEDMSSMRVVAWAEGCSSFNYM